MASSENVSTSTPSLSLPPSKWIQSTMEPARLTLEAIAMPNQVIIDYSIICCPKDILKITLLVVLLWKSNSDDDIVFMQVSFRVAERKFCPVQLELLCKSTVRATDMLPICYRLYCSERFDIYFAFLLGCLFGIRWSDVKWSWTVQRRHFYSHDCCTDTIGLLVFVPPVEPFLCTTRLVYQLTLPPYLFC